MKSSSVEVYERIRRKLKEYSNDELFYKFSNIEGLEKVRDDSNFGYVIEGGKDKGIFLNG